MTILCENNYKPFATAAAAIDAAVIGYAICAMNAIFPFYFFLALMLLDTHLATFDDHLLSLQLISNE